MTGRFVWTYESGDFENGAGAFTELNFPWWSEDTDPSLSSTIEVEAVEITMNGSYHDYGVDVSIKFLAPFSPDGCTLVDVTTNSFEIQRGVSSQGHVEAKRAVMFPAVLRNQRSHNRPEFSGAFPSFEVSHDMCQRSNL